MSTLSLYDTDARKALAQSREQALRERQAGPAAELRRFHNQVKTECLRAFVRGPRLLDLCSGKGGDLHKWVYHSLLQHVTCVEESKVAIEEAQRRWSVVRDRRRIDVEWIEDTIGSEPGRCYTRDRVDTVTCMFALNYIRDLRAFMALVSRHLVPAGTFIACLTYGPSVVASGSPGSGAPGSGALRISGQPKKHGDTYTCALPGTVLGEGYESTEYVVMPDMLLAEGRSVGLVPFETPRLPQRLATLLDCGVGEGFMDGVWPLYPDWSTSRNDPWMQASRHYCVVCLVKNDERTTKDGGEKKI